MFHQNQRERRPLQRNYNERAKKDYSQYTKQRPEKEMIFGIRAVMEAIQAGKDIEKVLIRRDLGGELAKELFDCLKGTTIPVQRVPMEKLNRTTQKNHQGVIGYISPITFQRIADLIPTIYESGKSPLLVLLDGVTDVRNFGAIARTCECAGVDALIIPNKGGAAINADAIKTSAGALHSLPVCREEDLEATLVFLKESGIQVVAATEKTTNTYTDIDMTQPLAIVMGAEDVGVSPELLELCSHRVRIPMTGNIASLNVSVAAGVMIYEAIRQRG